MTLDSESSTWDGLKVKCESARSDAKIYANASQILLDVINDLF